MRMTKLSTIASTGRLMKSSVKVLMSVLGSRICRGWIHLRFGREIVVNCHRHSVAQFEDARAHDGFIRFQSIDNRHETIVSTGVDRKSTRLNSSHTVISYAVFCLKKKKTKTKNNNQCNK